MGIETGIKRSPDPEWERRVIKRHPWNKEHEIAWSLCHSLSQDMQTNALLRLKAQKRKLKTKRDENPLFRNSEFYKSLENGERMRFDSAYADFFFGVMMRGIESILVDQWTPASQVCKWHNDLLDGTDIEPLSLPEHIDPWPTEENRKKMLEVDKEDPRHAIYFENGLSSLPIYMQELIFSSQTLPDITRHTIPLYKERVDILIATDVAIRNGLQALIP